MVKDHSDNERGRKKGKVLFDDQLSIFIMVIWHQAYGKTDRDETHGCHYIGYFFQLAARDLLYAPSHGQDSIYHVLCYTNMNTHCTMNGRSTMELHLTPQYITVFIS